MRITDSVLQELLQLGATVKTAERRIQEIKIACQEKGSFSTSKYVCSVYEQTAKRLASLDAVAAAVGMEVLEKNDLINYSTYKIVKVTAKIC